MTRMIDPAADKQDGEAQPTDAVGPGLEARYRVEKIRDPTSKHSECHYFVLDPQHDPLALPALARYAQVARAEGHTSLADDLDQWVRRVMGAGDV